jgi:hypothetical protein
MDRLQMQRLTAPDTQTSGAANQPALLTPAEGSNEDIKKRRARRVISTKLRPKIDNVSVNA